MVRVIGSKIEPKIKTLEQKAVEAATTFILLLRRWIWKGGVFLLKTSHETFMKRKRTSQKKYDFSNCSAVCGAHINHTPKLPENDGLNDVPRSS